MFVKKFEAASLEQALAAVKDEFGPGALILSTQNRKGSIFQKSGVEVTAALTENAKSQRDDALDTSDRLTRRQKQPAPMAITYRSNAAAPKAQVARESSGEKQRYIDIDAEVRVQDPVELRRDASPRRGGRNFDRFEDMWLELGFRPETAKEMTSRMLVDFDREDLKERAFLERVRIKLISESVRTLFVDTFDAHTKWLVVGGPGSGKTSILVKLALYLKRQGKEVALSSWESRKVMGSRELEGYSKLIKVPFLKPEAALNTNKIVLFDTSAWETQSSEEKWMHENYDSTLLVADARERLAESQHLAREISDRLKINAIAFSRLDMVQGRGFLFDLMRSVKVPLLGGSLSSSFKTPFKFFEPTEFSQYVTKREDL